MSNRKAMSIGLAIIRFKYTTSLNLHNKNTILMIDKVKASSDGCSLDALAEALQDRSHLLLFKGD